ncbi:MAG: LysM peptidoglycan-binding domain-containing protein [Chloroflexota bacterium]
MKKKRVLFLSLILVGGLLISACTRSATTPPEETPEGSGTAVSSNEELEAYLTAVAQQTETAGGSSDGNGGGANPTDEAVALTEAATTDPEGVATATPTPKPKPTNTPEPVDQTVPDSYTLRKGEFPYCIARRYDIDIDALLSANSMGKDQQYSEGIELSLPNSASGFKGSRSLRNHPVEYTTGGGDSFYSIACLFGDVLPKAIAVANDMKVNANISPGTVLNIP